MKPSLLRSYLFISLGITLLFIVLSVLAMELIHRANEPQMRPFDDNFPNFFAKLVEDSKGENRAKILDDIKELKFPIQLWLLSSDGQIRFSNNLEPLPFDLTTKTLPANHLEKVEISNPDVKAPPFLFGPPPGGAHGRSISVIKLDDQEYSYIVMRPKPFGAGPKPPSPLVPLMAILISILLASSVSVAVLFLYLKKTSAVADQVLDRLKSGDLKARFPITKMNEVGNLMYRFNVMADEIEELFERIRTKEQSRIRLLQDLAHDLRTPLASLQNMLALMGTKEKELPKVKFEELLGLSQKETSYLSRLVEDLLLLSRISDLEQVNLKKSRVDLIDLIESEIETVQAGEAVRKSVAIATSLEACPKLIQGDPHLLTRLFRNLLDNAFSFAEKEIKISCSKLNDGFEITIDNDGLPFDEETLKNYGERRITRVLDSQAEGRISIGLGSVIIKTIASLHGLAITPSNAKVGGQTHSQVQVFFPKSVVDEGT